MKIILCAVCMCIVRVFYSIRPFWCEASATSDALVFGLSHKHHEWIWAARFPCEKETPECEMRLEQMYIITVSRPLNGLNEERKGSQRSRDTAIVAN